MSFFNASTKADDVKQGGSNYINGSGIYPVVIVAPVVSASPGGSVSVDMFVDHLGQKQIVYGNLRTTNNDGTPNKIGAKVFNQLMIIAGLESCADPVEAEVPMGQKSAMKTVAVLEDLVDTEVLMRVQMEYSTHKGNIQEKKNIKAFFRASDNATAEEIVTGSDVGKGFEREQKYVDSVTYKDGLTPEDITAWIAAKRPKGTAGQAADGEAPAAPSFGQKRSFGQAAE